MKKNSTVTVRSVLWFFSTAIVGAHVPVTAQAHPSLEQKQTKAPTNYKAVMRVTHGCEESPTLTVRVSIPEGVFNVKPMPKPGWSIRVVKGPYKKTYIYHGKPYNSGIKEIIWSGGRLPSDYFDEFMFRVRVAAVDEPKKLYFPSVQECEKGQNRWTTVSESDSPRPKYPAPVLKVVPAEPKRSHH